MKISLSGDNDKGIGGSSLAPCREAELMGSDGKKNMNLAMIDALWSVLRCNGHKKIVLMTRQEVSFLL